MVLVNPMNWKAIFFNIIREDFISDVEWRVMFSKIVLLIFMMTPVQSIPVISKMLFPEYQCEQTEEKER